MLDLHHCTTAPLHHCTTAPLTTAPLTTAPRLHHFTTTPLHTHTHIHTYPNCSISLTLLDHMLAGLLRLSIAFNPYPGARCARYLFEVSSGHVDTLMSLMHHQYPKSDTRSLLPPSLRPRVLYSSRLPAKLVPEIRIYSGYAFGLIDHTAYTGLDGPRQLDFVHIGPATVATYP